MSKNVAKQSNNANNAKIKNGKRLDRNVLNYGMEWFDYHLTVGVYISMVISALWVVFVFIGEFYRVGIMEDFPALKTIDTIMVAFYGVYTLALLFTRKMFLAEDRRSFGLFMVVFLVRVAFHAFTSAYFLFINSRVIAESVFYEYYTYFSVLVTLINIFNIFYFYRRRGIFNYE